VELDLKQVQSNLYVPPPPPQQRRLQGIPAWGDDNDDDDDESIMYSRNNTANAGSVSGGQPAVMVHGNATSTWDNATSSWDTDTTTTSTTTETWGNTSSSSLDVGSAVFKIVGNCRDCPVAPTGSFNLFDDGFRRRLTETILDYMTTTTTTTTTTKGNGEDENESTSPSGFGFQGLRGGSRLSNTVSSRAYHASPSFHDDAHARFLQSAAKEETCECPVIVDESLLWNSSNLEGPSFSQDVFLRLFNDQLQELRATGRIEAIESAETIEEGQQVDCGSASQTAFESTIYSGLTVNLSSVTLEEASDIERVFLETYNRLAFTTCDGYFRNVANAELRVAPSDVNDDFQSLPGSVGRRLHDVIANRIANSRSLQESAWDHAFANFTTTNSSVQVNSTNSSTLLLNDTATGNGTASGMTENQDRRDAAQVVFAMTGSCR